jgi:hypothetical protein
VVVGILKVSTLGVAESATVTVALVALVEILEPPAIVTVAPVAVPESPARVTMPEAAGAWNVGAAPTLAVSTYPALATLLTIPTTLVAEATKTSPRATVDGYLAVDHAGVPAVLALKNCPVVPALSIDGTPADDVTNTPELAVVRAFIVLAADAYNKVLIAFVLG